MLPKCRTSLLSTIVNQCYQSVVLPVFCLWRNVTKVSHFNGNAFYKMLPKCRTSARH